MKRPARLTAALFVTMLGMGGVASSADGSSPANVSMAERSGGQREIVWPRWQARVGLAAVADTDATTGAQAEAALILGDYYFTRLKWGSSSGGLRATGGVLLGATTSVRTSALAETVALRAGQGLNLTFSRPQRQSMIGESVHASFSAKPYVGLGWSSVNLTGSWGLSADLGFTAGRKPVAAIDNSLRGTSRSLEELVRDLRLAPVLNLGLSYAF
jgi:hypothetical protein